MANVHPELLVSNQLYKMEEGFRQGNFISCALQGGISAK
jgi:hypothetical protein